MRLIPPSGAGPSRSPLLGLAMATGEGYLTSKALGDCRGPAIVKAAIERLRGCEHRDTAIYVCQQFGLTNSEANHVLHARGFNPTCDSSRRGLVR